MRLFPLLLALACAGCAGPAPAPDLPPVPAAFKESDPRWIVAPASDVQPRGTWWKAFADPVLDQLVAEAGRNNTSIQLAEAHLAQARALVRAAGAARFPQLNLQAGISRQGGPLVNAAGSDGTLASTSASFSYEPDLSGRLGKALDAATLDAGAEAASLASAQLVVQADVAQAYFALRAVDAERALLHSIQSDYLSQLALAERRVRAGYAAGFDLELIRRESAAIDAEAFALERRRAELEHGLAVLTGQVASSFGFDQAGWDAALPTVPPGLPSTLLTRRPDVAAAQRKLLAEQARGESARRAWFPNLLLTASSGYASPDLAQLLDGSARAFSIGSMLALPLLDGGRRAAQVAQADARAQAALAAYRERILVAFRETEDQLSALRLLAGEETAQANALAASERTVQLAQSRVERGLSSQLDLILVRRDALQARRQAVRLKLARFQATVGLFRALGGDWKSKNAV
jgi:multidrug efflux system outer membrane protein